MGNININGNQYQLSSKGKVNVTPVQSPDKIKNDYNDDIVVKQANSKLVDISADELDIEGSWLKPYVGLPNKGDTIHFVDDAGTEVKGTVVFSEDENDNVTRMQRSETYQNVQKKADKYQKQAQQWVDKTGKNLEQGAKELDKKLTQGAKELDKKITQGAKKIEKEIQSDAPPEEKVKKGINQIVDGSTSVVRDVVKEATGHTITIGQTETYKKGDVTFGASIGKRSTLNSTYTFAVKDIDERLFPMGQGLIEKPHSRTLFAAHAVEARIGPKEMTAGYKGSIGVEFNLPNNNDFSVAGVGSAYAGVRPQEGAPVVGVGLGIEARYQVNDKFTVYGGPTQRISYSKGFEIAPTFEAGVSLKF